MFFVFQSSPSIIPNFYVVINLLEIRFHNFQINDMLHIIPDLLNINM